MHLPCASALIWAYLIILPPLRFSRETRVIEGVGNFFPNQPLYHAEQQPAVLALNRPLPSGWCEAMEQSGNGGSLALVCNSPTLIAVTELSASSPDEFPKQHSLEDQFSGLSDPQERG